MGFGGNYRTDSDHNEGEYRNGCRGKRQFTSKKIARGMLRTMLRHEAERGNPDPEEDLLGVYGCKACRHWHIGHFRDVMGARRSRG